MGAKTKQVAHESEMYAYYCLPQSENETMDGNGTKSRPQSQHQRRQQSSWKARQNPGNITIAMGGTKRSPNLKIQKGVLTLKY